MEEKNPERTKVDRDTLNQEKHDEVKNLIGTVKLVIGQESTKRCVLTPRHVDKDQTSTGKPVVVDQKEEHKIDFRVPGLSHSVVQNNSEFKSLYKGSELILIEQHFMPIYRRITSTTHEARHQRRWSANWETWSYSSCAKLHQKYNVLTVFLTGIKGLCIALAANAWSTANPERNLNRQRLDAHSVPNYVKKKGATHGARHAKTEVQRNHHPAWNAWKRCCKKVDSQGEHFTGIHDRFLRDPIYPIYRESQLAIGWTEEKCKECDELAQEDHTYKLTQEERRRYKGHWYLSFNKTGKNGPMKLRSGYRAAVIMKNRLHPESGEPTEEPIHPGQQRRTRQGREIFSEDYLSSARLDQYTVWQYWPSTSSSSWWHESEWSWKWAHKKCFCSNLFLLQLVSFTVDSDIL